MPSPRRWQSSSNGFSSSLPHAHPTRTTQDENSTANESQSNAAVHASAVPGIRDMFIWLEQMSKEEGMSAANIFSQIANGIERFVDNARTNPGTALAIGLTLRHKDGVRSNSLEEATVVLIAKAMSDERYDENSALIERDIGFLERAAASSRQSSRNAGSQSGSTWGSLRLL